MNKDRAQYLVDYIGTLFTDIRGDWTDPRWECRSGWEACARLRGELKLAGDTKYRNTPQTDEQYYEWLKMQVEH